MGEALAEDLFAEVIVEVTREVSQEVSQEDPGPARSSRRLCVTRVKPVRSMSGSSPR